MTGRALRDFILEQSKIRGIGKVLSLRSRPGFSFVGDDSEELHSFMRAVLCELAVYHSPPNDIKLMVVTRHPELWSCWCGCRTISTTRCSTRAASGGWSSPRPPNSRTRSIPSCTARVAGRGRRPAVPARRPCSRRWRPPPATPSARTG